MDRAMPGERLLQPCSLYQYFCFYRNIGYVTPSKKVKFIAWKNDWRQQYRKSLSLVLKPEYNANYHTGLIPLDHFAAAAYQRRVDFQNRKHSFRNASTLERDLSIENKQFRDWPHLIISYKQERHTSPPMRSAPHCRQPSLIPWITWMDDTCCHLFNA